MALQKQVIPAPFDKGVDTKTNQFLTTSFLSLQNCYQQKTGSVQKRYGGTNLSTQILNTNLNIDFGKTLLTYNNELLMHDGETLYSYIEPLNQWDDVSELYNNTIVSTPVIANSYNQTVPDRDISGGLELYAWQDSRGGVYYTVLDNISESIVVPEQVFNSSYSPPKGIAWGIYIFYPCHQKQHISCLSALQPKYRIVIGNCDCFGMQRRL